MDREHFDALTRAFSASGSRRAALAGLLSAAALRHVAPVVAKAKRGESARVAVPARCYRGANCTPGKGKNTSRCDFSGSTVFFQGDFRGANLSQSNFTGTVLAQADFRGANLSGACLVGANLSEAKLGASVNLDKAIFCRTLMPDGSIEDRDCDKGTACCPTPPAICPQGEVCAPDCIGAPNQICSIFGTPCCNGLACTSTIFPLGLTFCQSPCTTTTECKQRYGNDYTCRIEAADCIFLPGALCCQKID